MNNFLISVNSSLQKLDTYDNVYVVMGNESCDLDSAVSALTFAYYLYLQPNKLQNSAVIPLLNIEEDEFPLRTETKYFLEKLRVDTSKLVYRNNINIKKIANENKLKLTLVDHHTLPVHNKYLEQFVVEIIDHRPKDDQANLKNISVTLDTVGSCATLIANILINNKSILDDNIAKLLHGTIILDTINFNTKANRFTQLDVTIAAKLEELYKITYSREEIYNELVAARSNVSNLSAFQILHRDMKIINGVPFPGVPMLISDFLKLPDAVESFKKLCASKKCKVIVPMGLVTKNDKVFREIGVFATENCELKNVLVQFLKNDKELKVTEVDKSVEGLVLFAQANVKASRKHIVPMLGPIIVNCKAGNNL